MLKEKTIYLSIYLSIYIYIYIVRANKMTKFDCGCRIIHECITLNNGDYKKPSFNHLLKAFVNVCGKCGKKQMKFQQMENKLLEMETQRMEMFMNFEDEDEEEYNE